MHEKAKLKIFYNERFLNSTHSVIRGLQASIDNDFIDHEVAKQTINKLNEACNILEESNKQIRKEIQNTEQVNIN